MNESSSDISALTQAKVEKPTLGDLGALAALKDKLKKAEDGNAE